MPAIALAVNPRAISQRKCQWLRSLDQILGAPVAHCEFVNAQVRFEVNVSRRASRSTTVWRDTVLPSSVMVGTEPGKFGLRGRRSPKASEGRQPCLPADS